MIKFFTYTRDDKVLYIRDDCEVLLCTRDDKVLYLYIRDDNTHDDDKVLYTHDDDKVLYAHSTTKYVHATTKSFIYTLDNDTCPYANVAIPSSDMYRLSS